MPPKQHKKPRKPSRRSAPAPSRRGVRRAAVSSLFEGSARQHAVDYYRLLMDPFGAPLARVPDQLPIPTGLCETNIIAEVTLGACTPDNNFQTTMVVRPGVQGFNPTSGTSEKIAWLNWSGATAAIASSPDPLGGAGGFAATNWAEYRPVAMGIKVHVRTPTLSRGGPATLAQNPANFLLSAGAGQTLSSQTAVFSSPQATHVDLAELGSDRYYVWRPNDYQSDIDFSQPSTSISQPCLVLGFASSVAQILSVEVRTIYEFQPFLGVAQAFDCECIVGNVSTIADIQGMLAGDVSGNIATTPSVGQVVTPQLESLQNSLKSPRPNSYMRQRLATFHSIASALRPYAAMLPPAYRGVGTGLGAAASAASALYEWVG
jgi:hypothetical protein